MRGRVVGIVALLIWLFWTTSVSAQDSSSELESEANRAQATAHIDLGRQALNSGDYAEALDQLQRAFDLLPDPELRIDLGRCHAELGHRDEARQELELYLVEMDPSLISTEHREEVESILSSLVERSELPVEPVHAPDPEITADSRPVELPESPSLAGPWAVLGSGLALLLTAGVVDIIAYARGNRADSEPFNSGVEYDDWYNSTYYMAVAGDLLLGIGATVAVVGLVWLLVTRSQRASGGQSFLHRIQRHAEVRLEFSRTESLSQGDAP